MKQAITIIVVFALGIGVGIGADRYVLQDSKEQYTAVSIEDSINGISELAVLEWSYTDQENWDGGSRQIFGKDIPFTNKSMLLVFSGTVKVGPDMEKMKVETSGNKISVILPHSDILSHEIDEDSIVNISVKNGILNRITPENVNEVRKTAKENKEKEIRESDCFDRADEKAVSQIENFLQTAYPDAEISVAVKAK